MFMREPTESRHRNLSDRGRCSSPGVVVNPVPFTYGHDGKLDEPGYWAYQPRLETGKSASAKTNHRSVSFNDPFEPNYAQEDMKRFRVRVSSLPSRTTADLDLSLVDDIFQTTNYTMLTETLPKKKPEPATTRGNSTRGWLEVSIDSTMPTSPALHKDSFDLATMQSTLPLSPTQLVIKKTATCTSDSSCLLTKLMPCPSDETYSRKVFIGGLPPDIDQEEIRVSFQRYGSVTIDWPHKIHSKSRVPPKGYAFLLFKEETSVHKLLASCVSEGDKLFAYIKYNCIGTTLTRKKCQIRPWKISDSYYFADEDKKVDNRKAVFVGGVPRPLKASELAEVMTEKFGTVSFVAIDCDCELKYPKGAACVVFLSHASYIAAVSSRFMQLVFGSIEKKVEVKPYILEDQLCDECNGIQSDGLPAPFFCGSVTCLKYYCEHCWATFHSLSGRQNHRPMFKDIFDRDKFS